MKTFICTVILPLICLTGESMGSEVYVTTSAWYPGIKEKVTSHMLVNDGDMPEMVGLGWVDHALKIMHLECAGVLVDVGIEDDIVVSSAVCVQDLINAEYRGALVAFTAKGLIKIKHLRVNPDYVFINRPPNGLNTANIKDDIGVVMLEDTKNQKIQSRFSLPEYTQVQENIPNGNAAWLYDATLSSTMYKDGEIWYIFNTTEVTGAHTEQETCEDILPVKSSNWSPNGKFCEKWEAEFFPRAGTAYYTTGQNGNEFTLFGIGSYPYFGKPTRFAYVPVYRKWIDETIVELHGIKEKEEKSLKERIAGAFEKTEIKIAN